MTTMQPLSYMLYSFLYIYEWLSLCSCITFCIIILNFSLCVCVGLPCTSYYIQHTHIQSHFDCVSINAVHRSWKQTFFLLWLLPRCPLASISFTPSSLSLSLPPSLSHTHTITFLVSWTKTTNTATFSTWNKNLRLTPLTYVGRYLQCNRRRKCVWVCHVCCCCR